MLGSLIYIRPIWGLHGVGEHPIGLSLRVSEGSMWVIYMFHIGSSVYAESESEQVLHGVYGGSMRVPWGLLGCGFSAGPGWYV